MRFSPGSKLAERYTVLSALGRGGVATVWLARHEHLHTLHALKVLSIGSERLQQRLITEARIQAMLKHPNVVAAADLVPFDGGVGLVLEYVKGPSLRALLAARRLAPPEVELLFRGIAAGVACAHAHGLVHRDLKPANVLLQVEPELVPKVTDFGLAKLLLEPSSSASGGTRTGATLGTPAYMAPEQVRDAASVDARADVFALGSLAYEMLTGARAFEGDDPADTMIRVKEARFVPLRERDPTLPDAMIRAVEGALVADPAERIPSVEAMLAVWGEHPVPRADRAKLTADVARIQPATPALDHADRTWSESDAEAAPVIAASTRAPPRKWSWTAPVGAAAVFAAGVGAATLWQQPPPPPREAQVAAPSADPSAQRAVTDLSFLMTDLSTASIKGRKSLDWLRRGLPDQLAHADALAADIHRRFPGDEVELQADYDAGMVRFLAYSYLAWVGPPAGADPATEAEWEDAATNEFRPAAFRYLDEARARFDALAASTHPRAADTLWPRMGRQMTAQIEEIPR